MSAQKLLDRIPPQSLEAEQATLGAMLMERDAIMRVRDLLKPEDFYSPQHQTLYAVMLRLFREEKAVELTTVQVKLQDLGKLESSGGRSYLISLQDASPTAAAIEQYAEIVLEKSRRRQLIREADELRNLAWSEEVDPDAIISATSKRLWEIGASAVSDVEDFGRAVVLAESERLHEQASEKRRLRGLDTGISKLNHYMPGWSPGEYTVLAARPSAGKLAFMLQQCCHAADGGAQVLLFSLEMAGSQLADRYFASAIPKELSSIMQAWLSDEELTAVMQATARAYGWKFLICQRADLTISQLRAMARNAAARTGGLDLIAVDYIQLLDTDRRAQNDNAWVAEISRGLKALARELRCPVLALSQLSRDVEKERRWPRLSDLRDSGAIESDADNVIFLHNAKHLASRNLPDPECESITAWTKHMRGLFLAKQRNGPLARFALSWSGEYQRFAGLEIDREEEGSVAHPTGTETKWRYVVNEIAYTEAKLEFYRAWVHAEAPAMAAAIERVWLEKCEGEGIHGEEGER